MRVILSGHCFKYEIEAVLKLFLPNKSFDFAEFSAVSADDNLFARVKQTRTKTLCYVKLNLTSYKLKSVTILPPYADESEKEYTLCKLLFGLLEYVCGYTPPWGMLTGVRPLKVYGTFQLDKYFVSTQKLQLLRKTYETQKPLLEKYKNTPNMQNVSLYVSIPFCPTRCAYCSFVSHAIENTFGLIDDYVRLLCVELEYLGKLTAENNLSLRSIYIGGGTPTVLNTVQLEKLLSCIAKSFNFAYLNEYTVEAGRPDTITDEKLKLLKDFNVSRISINPQTLNDKTLVTIGRNHSADDFYKAFRLARLNGFNNINTDLIAGLPDENLDDFKVTLQKLLDFSPENITIHAMSIKRSSSFANALTVSDSEKSAYNILAKSSRSAPQMLQYASTELSESGYKPYYLYRQKDTAGNLENTGYSKRERECIYNVLIMDDTHTILGAGCGASTKLVKDRIHRHFNYKFPYEYIGQFETMLEKKRKAIEQLAIDNW